MRAFASSRLIVTYEDELLSEALSKMLANDIGRLPVVKRDDPRTIVGYLGRPGIMAGRFGATRKSTCESSGWVGEVPDALGEAIVTIAAVMRLKRQRSAWARAFLNRGVVLVFATAINGLSDDTETPKVPPEKPSM